MVGRIGPEEPAMSVRPAQVFVVVTTLLATVALACLPPPAPSPTAAPEAEPQSGAAPAKRTEPRSEASSAASPVVAAGPAAASPAADPAASPRPAAAAPAAAQPGGAAPSSCKVAQLYTSPTSDKGWSWAHEQSFLSIQRDLPYVDLSIREDSVPDGNKQATENLLESMVQQGAQAVYTTSLGFMEPTRTVAARHPEVAFFHASGSPGPNDPPNIGYYFAFIEEGRYITGEIAGLVVEPGANLGYLAAFPISEVFRGENAFALGVRKTNPTAKVHNRWVLTWSDPKLEMEAAEALLDAPVRAQLISQHQDSVVPQLAAQSAGKWGIAYNVDMNDAAPRATLTAATWNWAVHNRRTVEAVCTGAWTEAGRVTIPKAYVNWLGSMRDGAVGVAPLNLEALANHPRRDEIMKLYDDEVAKFRSGEKSFETIFTGPIRDNAGQLKIEGRPDIAALFDDRGHWFVENVVGSPKP
jgi:basic membrane protein A